jgi:hypothetical protein
MRITAWIRDYGDKKPSVFITDVTMLLVAAKDCERLSLLLQSVTADRDERAVQKGELLAEIERLRADLQHELAEVIELRRQLDNPTAPWNNA